MRRAVCPGSFDPVTLGHLDIFERASHMFDEVIISVFVNPTKDKALFPMEERVALIEKATAHLPNVRVTSFSGLLNEFCRKEEAAFIVRGLRAFSDFEYEFQMAQANRKLCYKAETIFLTSKSEYTYLSSSMVKQIAMFGGDISDFVPECILDRINERLKRYSRIIFRKNKSDV